MNKKSSITTRTSSAIVVALLCSLPWGGVMAQTVNPEAPPAPPAEEKPEQKPEEKPEEKAPEKPEQPSEPTPAPKPADQQLPVVQVIAGREHGLVAKQAAVGVLGDKPVLD